MLTSVQNDGSLPEHFSHRSNNQRDVSRVDMLCSPAKREGAEVMCWGRQFKVQVTEMRNARHRQRRGADNQWCNWLYMQWASGTRRSSSVRQTTANETLQFKSVRLSTRPFNWNRRPASTLRHTTGCRPRWFSCADTVKTYPQLSIRLTTQYCSSACKRRSASMMPPTGGSTRICTVGISTSAVGPWSKSSAFCPN